MKKILTYITEEEKDQSVLLQSICATYETLLRMTAYDLNKEEIRRKLRDSKEALNAFWFHLTDKYQIPLYTNKNMRVSVDDCYVYIEE